MGRKASSIIIVLIVLLLASIPFALEYLPQFFPESILSEFGSEIVLAPIVCIVVILFIVLIIFATRGKKQISIPLFNPKQKRDSLVSQLKEAEKQFLKHKIDKDTFDKISKEKNAELIKIEAEIDAGKKHTLGEKDIKKMEGLSQDKKEVLTGLLEQKQKKIHELQIAERSYLKRKIDEQAYKKISSEIKEEIISIEGQIKAIQTAEEIAKLKLQLKAGAKEITLQEKKSKNRPETSLEDDVFSQLDMRK